MNNETVFTQPIDNKNNTYLPIYFNKHYRLTSDDKQNISIKVNEILNSTLVSGTNELETSIGQISIVYKKSEKNDRLKIVEGIIKSNNTKAELKKNLNISLNDLLIMLLKKCSPIENQENLKVMNFILNTSVQQIKLSDNAKFIIFKTLCNIIAHCIENPLLANQINALTVSDKIDFEKADKMKDNDFSKSLRE